MTTNRPPSCDQLPELKPCPMCGFSNTEVIKGKIDYQAHCPACLMHGPDRATEIYAIESWNAIPRRSEVLELTRLVETTERDLRLSKLYERFKAVVVFADKLRKEMES